MCLRHRRACGLPALDFPAPIVPCLLLNIRLLCSLQPVGKPPTCCIDFEQHFAFLRPVELHAETLNLLLEMTHFITVHAPQVAEWLGWLECFSSEGFGPGKEKPSKKKVQKWAQWPKSGVGKSL
jgi:hypothetical protein